MLIHTNPNGPTFGAKADGLPTSPPVTRRTTKRLKVWN